MRKRIDRLLPVRFRAAAAMPAAILTVHQLRYQLAFGSRTDQELASQGHQYLGAAAPLAAMLLAALVGLFLADLSRAWRRAREDGAAPVARAAFPKIWFLAALSLLLTYCGQELLEGVLTTGHPDGLAGIFGAGGLWAVPLSVLLGGLVAALLKAGDAAVRWAASRRRRRRAPRARIRRTARPDDFAPLPLGPLASAAAGRAPPPPLLP